VDFVDARRRQLLAGGEEVLDLAEDPRPALRGAADHHGVGAGVRRAPARLLRRAMSPLAMTGCAPRP
jgi:hypothetical protein